MAARTVEMKAGPKVGWKAESRAGLKAVQWVVL
jgi:hypothetical protein